VSVWQDAGVDTARTKQFAHLDVAKAQLMAWAGEHGVPLVRVEFIVPFVETAFYVSVWLFYGTDTDVASLDRNGGSQLVKDEFLRLLEADGYPAEWLSEVDFSSDSHENVVRHYEGSYFYRLR
jgi:hypothetical protein